MTPHAYRRNKWSFIVIGGFIVLMAIGLFSCKKEIEPIDEPKHGNHDIREWTKRLAYPQHGESCDTAMNGKY